MTRIDGQRSHYWVKRLSKVVFQKLFLLAAYFLRTKQMNAFGCKLRQNRIEEAEMLFFRKLMNCLGDSFQGRRAGDAVRRCPAVIRAMLQISHPNHKKFVKIGTEDGEKLYALKKRNRGVFGFLQNTSIEFKPRVIATNQQTLFIFHQGLPKIVN